MGGPRHWRAVLALVALIGLGLAALLLGPRPELPPPASPPPPPSRAPGPTSPPVPPGPTSSVGQQGSCGPTLQSLVDAAPPRSVVRVPACAFRETVTIKKPLTLVGQPGSEIRGSDDWSSGWTANGKYWQRGRLPSLPSGDWPCQSGSDGRCRRPEQVFFDGTPLVQVEADPDRGQFAVDGSRQVILADDPRGHLVEVTTRTQWVVGQSDDVVIQGLTMKHAANRAQDGAIKNGGRDNWTIRDNVLSDAHGAIVALGQASGLKLLDNDISRGGQEGVNVSGASGIVIQGNRLHDNNTEAFDAGWEAGGMKVTNSGGALIEGNEVDDNDGPGIWCDDDCRDAVLRKNRVHDNSKYGIAYEISRGGKIYANAAWENGWGFPKWGFGAGIVCQNCAETEIFDNTVAWNAGGISILEQNRKLVDSVQRVFVHDNTIIAADGVVGLAWLSDNRPYRLFQDQSGNRGAQNRYWFPGAEGGATRFEWSGPKRTLSSLNATPGEDGGRYLSAAEKEAALAAFDIPSAPKGQ